MYVMRLHLNILVITNIRSLMTQNVWQRLRLLSVAFTLQRPGLYHTPCKGGFYDGQSTTGIDIIWLLQYYPPNIITLILPKHLYIYCRFYIILAMTVSYTNTKIWAHVIVTNYECNSFSLHSLSISYTVKAMINISYTLHRNRPKQPETLRRKKLSPSSDRRGKQITYSRTFIINMCVTYITSTCGSVVQEFGHSTQQNKTDRINQHGVHQRKVCGHLPVQMPLRTGAMLEVHRSSRFWVDGWATNTFI
jgi:hypothetical protein